MDDVQSGFCLSCAERVDARIVPEGDRATVTYEWRRCPELSSASLGSVLLYHPVVIGFHWDHDIDLRSVRSLTLGWLHDDYTTVVNDDPLRLECAVTLDDEVLVLSVDETATVLDVERRGS
jgi:hypothetical protein